MRNLLKLFYILISVMTIQPLFSVYMGERDHEESSGGGNIKIKQVIIDFDATRPTDLNIVDDFTIDLLGQKLQSRIERINTVDKYAKKNIEIYFRNINYEDNLSSSCLVMKMLGYSKYSSENPSIFLENSADTSADIKDKTNNKREQYNSDGLQ